VSPPFARRDLIRAAAAGAVVAAAAAGASVNAASVAVRAGVSSPVGAGIRAFKLYTGPDHVSHALEGTIDERDRTDVIAFSPSSPQSMARSEGLLLAWIRNSIVCMTK